MAQSKSESSLDPFKIIKGALSHLVSEVDILSPLEVAEAASLTSIRGQLSAHLARKHSPNNLHTDTARELYEIQQNSQNVVEKLALVGYQNFRHLRAHGLTFHEICSDLGINVNDLVEFMRLSPTAAEDAVQDEELCADARTIKLDEYVKNEPLLSRNDTIRLQMRTSIQMEMNKRLSARWAQGNSTPEQQQALEEASKQATITMVINNVVDDGRKPVLEVAEQDIKVIEEPSRSVEVHMGLPGE